MSTAARYGAALMRDLVANLSLTDKQVTGLRENAKVLVPYLRKQTPQD